MTLQVGPLPVLTHRFLDELPQLAVPWQAARISAPSVVLFNEQLAAELGLDSAAFQSATGAHQLCGQELAPGTKPVAMAYSGHQFGYFNPQLGDGRALLLGEFPDGRDLHLKGSGRTPFSRNGDGLAALGPMLREYVISQAMHALGIPTTRSLAVVATGQPVYRESALPGAVLARVASSHLRVGTFQYARATGDIGLLRRLADYAISLHYPQVNESRQPYLELFRQVLQRQADLVAAWMSVGFIHGVMNTDNMTISGETIDYGPCAFMEVFDPNTVFSSIDAQGRYAFGNQPAIAQWNLARFAECLLPLIAGTDLGATPSADDEHQVQRAIDEITGVLHTFPDVFRDAWLGRMRSKLGQAQPQARDDVDSLIDELPAVLADNRLDLTRFFSTLTEVAGGDAKALTSLSDDQRPQSAELTEWVATWRSHSPDVEPMRTSNPLYIPRNHLVEEALAAAESGDLTSIHQLLDVVQSPYTRRPGSERYEQPAPPDAAPYVTYCGT